MESILLLGKNGQVGFELESALKSLGKIQSLGREDFNHEDPEDVKAVVRKFRPTCIVNAAAYTAVEKAEKERNQAFTLNSQLPRALAEAAEERKAFLIHYSTDYVFDGAKKTPYEEEDPCRPLNVYGESKRAGELAVLEATSRALILRVTSVYAARGKNFLLTILKLAREKSELKIVNDQITAPTSSRSIARATAKILRQCLERPVQSSMICHLSPPDFTTWYDFADYFLRRDPQRASQVLDRLLPIPSSDYPSKTMRPLYSVLSNQKLKRLFDVELPPWKAQVDEIMKELSTSTKA